MKALLRIPDLFEYFTPYWRPMQAIEGLFRRKKTKREKKGFVFDGKAKSEVFIHPALSILLL